MTYEEYVKLIEAFVDCLNDLVGYDRFSIDAENGIFYDGSDRLRGIDLTIMYKEYCEEHQEE